MFYLNTLVKACSLCRTIFMNGGNLKSIEKKRYIKKMKIGDEEFKVLYNFGHGFIVLHSGRLAYLSKRIRLRHLYRKDNSYPVSVDIINRLRKLNINVVIIYEAGSRLYFFYTDDYAQGMTIQHKGYDNQYSLPLERAFNVIDIRPKKVIRI